MQRFVSYRVNKQKKLCHDAENSTVVDIADSLMLSNDALDWDSTQIWVSVCLTLLCLCYELAGRRWT